MRNLTIGFDVYGTLVDPLKLNIAIKKIIANNSDLFAKLWRQKQLEYTFRRGLMGNYQNFDVCTKHALQYAIDYFGINVSNKEKNILLSYYKTLQPFADAIPALKCLKENNYKLVVFSNGIASTLKTLLTNAKLLKYIDKIISVDEIQTYKPNPKVYEYLASETDTNLSNCWVVSSNSFDIMGAKSAGLNAAWITRNKSNILDPWEYKPDIITKDLIELSNYLK